MNRNKAERILASQGRILINVAEMAEEELNALATGKTLNKSLILTMVCSGRSIRMFTDWVRFHKMMRLSYFFKHWAATIPLMSDEEPISMELH